MKKLFAFLLFFMTLSLGSAYAQTMTDDQVVEYLKQAQAQGMTQSQMTSELLLRGVTMEQLERIRDNYMTGSDMDEDTEETNTQQTPRSRNKKNVSTPADQRGFNETRNRMAAVISDRETDGSFAKPADANAEAIPLYDAEGNPVTTKILYDENGNPINVANKTQSAPIFGHNLFTNKNLTFEPNVNLATPENYRLGPGDEVIIDIWGASETTIREEITPDGNVQISGLGPVHLSGMTIKAARTYLQRELAKIYSGLDSNESSVQLTLGNSRSIQINIMGEVETPGTYTLSAFSSVFHALYSAGGVNNIGTLRSVKVFRNNKTVADVDIYAYIMQGKMNDDVRLQEGDVIYVDTYKSLVQITGKVRRPMVYEMKGNETVAQLLRYAGDFTGDAYKKAVRVVRKTGREYQFFHVDEMDYSVFKLEDGDEVSIESVLTRYENRIEIKGAVYREGVYQLDGQVNTVKALIKKAEGLRGDAFLNRAVLDREKDNYDHEMISIDVKGILDGTVADIPLRKNDVLYIPSIHELKEEETVAIHGEVGKPGTYLYAQNMTIEDLVVMAGGLLEDAATIRVDVTRRIKDPKSEQFSSRLGNTYSFNLIDGLHLNQNGFTLEPFDEVYVRQSPSYRKQQNVTIAGEILFGGSYALQNKNERISELVARAGGVTPAAYVKGARLLRYKTADERRREQDVVDMASSTKGSTSINVQTADLIDNTYTVALDLEKALQHPNSDWDVVLRDSDIIYIPEQISTVKITGAVMYPNTVLFQQGMSLKQYINQAGGFNNLARKKKIYAVYMNGQVTRLKNGAKIEPGCEIVVPSKDRGRMSLSEIVGLGSSMASLFAVIASTIAVLRK